MLKVIVTGILTVEETEVSKQWPLEGADTITSTDIGKGLRVMERWMKMSSLMISETGGLERQFLAERVQNQQSNAFTLVSEYNTAPTIHESCHEC
jgi:hypothetical protein